MPQQPNNNARLPKSSILRRKADISELYQLGTSVLCFPIKAIVIITPEKNTAQSQVIFTVSKKYHKRAVSRNLLRRRTKEAFRLKKAYLDNCLKERNISAKIVLSYVSKEILNYSTIKDAVDRIIEKVADMAVPTAD